MIYNIYMFNLLMEQITMSLNCLYIKLQCLCSVEPKDASGTSAIKTKVGHYCI